MIRKIFFSFLGMLFVCSSILSQALLEGRVLIKGSPDVLNGVNIKNLRTGVYNHTDMGGNYRITAVSGDTLVFSFAGYRPDTIMVSSKILAHEFDVYLVTNIVALPAIEVDALSKYQADSIGRKEDYANILNRKHPVKLINEKRVADNPGLNFSPIGYFSKRERQKRKLIKQIQSEDENEYIDARFPRSRVAMVTGLSGDSLQQFMLRYRPGYTFCRAAGSQDILLYINDKLVLFRKEKMPMKIRR